MRVAHVHIADSFLIDDVIILENVYSSKKNFNTSSPYSPSKGQGQYRCKCEVGPDNTATASQITNGYNSWYNSDRKEIVSTKKSVKDASTTIEKLPELEVADAYFDEHPVLDFVGTCCGMVR
ncbi:hypothetical protein COOONC_24197 [Cooperia oncophora]